MPKQALQEPCNSVYLYLISFDAKEMLPFACLTILLQGYSMDRHHYLCFWNVEILKIGEEVTLLYVHIKNNKGKSKKDNPKYVQPISLTCISQFSWRNDTYKYSKKADVRQMHSFIK